MIFTADSSVLVIFCKRPKVGVGKQRVAAELGNKAALELSTLLLDAAIADAAEWPGAVVIAPADPNDTDWATNLLPGATVVPQQGKNLGERINHVDRELRSQGARTIIIIGTDAPGLNAATLTKARQTLATADTVLIPARDGGVTLLGANNSWPDLGRLPWETADLGSALAACCAASGLSTVLPVTDVSNDESTYDIDHYADLLAVKSRLEADPRPTRQALATWADAQLGISVVVPIKRDSTALHRLLTSLMPQLTQHDEVLVVDAEQTPESERICRYFGVRYLSNSASRGCRMNAGARSATRTILWFVHADTAIADDAIHAIRQRVLAGDCGGYFRFRFSGVRSWKKTLLQAAINFRTLWGIPYGDQALFVTRSAFEQAGGYTDSSLFEEVTLVKRLRRMDNFARLSMPVGVSPRRWEQDGWLLRTAQNRMLVLGHMLGVPTHLLARAYRRPHKSGASAVSLADEKLP